MRLLKLTGIAAGLVIIIGFVAPIGCNIFVGDDWGWEGDPCNADGHCQPSLSCFWGTGNPACVPESTWTALECTVHEDCHAALDDRFDCNDRDYYPPTCDSFDRVTYCFNDDGMPDSALCEDDTEHPKCKYGICAKADEQAKVFGNQCAGEPTVCTEGGLGCFTFAFPGAASEVRCSEGCLNSTFCDENYPGTVCTWTEDGMACAHPDWTGGYLEECQPGIGCGEPPNACVAVADNDADLCTKECTQGQCDEGLLCCRGMAGEPTHCLPKTLCACGQPCAEWERCNGVSEQCEPLYPIAIPAGDLVSPGSVAVSDVGEGIILVANGDLSPAGTGPRVHRFNTITRQLEPAVDDIPEFSKIDSLAFMPTLEGARILAVIGLKDGLNRMEVLSTQNWDVPGTGPNGRHSLEYTPNGSHLVSIEKKGTGVEVSRHDPLDLGNTQSQIIGGASDIIKDLAVSLDGGLAAVGTGLLELTGNALLISLGDMMAHSLPGFSDHVQALTFAETATGQPSLVMATVSEVAASGPVLKLWHNDQSEWTDAVTDLDLGGSPGPVLALASMQYPNPHWPAGHIHVFGLDKGSSALHVWIAHDLVLEHLGSVQVPINNVGKADIDIDRTGQWLVTSGDDEVLLWDVEDLLKRKIGYGFPCTDDGDCAGSSVFTACREDHPVAKACGANCDLSEQCGLGYCCTGASGHCVSALNGPCM